MWQVKQIDPKTKKIKTIKSNFSSEEKANAYISEHMKEISDVWAEEKGGKGNLSLDMSDKKGQWIWLYSKKKEEFFPYGIIIDHTSQFAKIQTKENGSDYFDLTDMRIERIKEMLQDNNLKFETEGHFVTLKEYL